MSPYTSEKGSKASNASDQSRGNQAAVVDAKDRAGDNTACVDRISDRKERAYPKKYGAIFAQLAIKEQMVSEEKEKKHREEEEEEDERKVEEKKKMEMELGGDGKQREIFDDDDEDDEWEEIDFSEDEVKVG